MNRRKLNRMKKKDPARYHRLAVQQVRYAVLGALQGGVTLREVQGAYDQIINDWRCVEEMTEYMDNFPIGGRL